MQFENLINLNEQIAYLNGILNAVGVLNTTSSNIMDHYFIELDLEHNNYEKMLRDHLDTPNWGFEFVQIEDWKQHIECHTEHFFTNIMTEISGYDIFRDKSRYTDLSKRYNLMGLLESFVYNLDKILQQFANVQVFFVKIDSSHDYSSGYFAHDESNYLFKIADGKVLFLHLTVYD